MLHCEFQSTRRIGFNGCAWLDNETTFLCGYLLPNHGLAWLQIHVTLQLRRNRHLAALSNGRFHMIMMSCETPRCVNRLIFLLVASLRKHLQNIKLPYSD